jgi:TM2 domain-containing membrane protein YozV
VAPPSDTTAPEIDAAEPLPSEPERQAAPATAVGNPYLAVVLAWVVPGLGHVYLKRPARGVLFFLLIVAALFIGCQVEGNLYTVIRNQPLTILGTAGAMGMGSPYFLLRSSLFHYQGNLIAPGYEYGTAFLLTAGLMNLLLILDAWDIARGYKE